MQTGWIATEGHLESDFFFHIETSHGHFFEREQFYLKWSCIEKLLKKGNTKNDNLRGV